MELSKDTDVAEIPQNNSVFPHISIVKIPRSNPGDLIKTPITIIPKEGILSDPKTDEYERTFCPRTINTRNGQIENRKRNIRRLESTKPYHLRTRLEKQKETESRLAHGPRIYDSPYIRSLHYGIKNECNQWYIHDWDRNTQRYCVVNPALDDQKLWIPYHHLTAFTMEQFGLEENLAPIFNSIAMTRLQYQEIREVLNTQINSLKKVTQK